MAYPGEEGVDGMLFRLIQASTVTAVAPRKLFTSVTTMDSLGFLWNWNACPVLPGPKVTPPLIVPTKLPPANPEFDASPSALNQASRASGRPVPSRKTP